MIEEGENFLKIHINDSFLDHNKFRNLAEELQDKGYLVLAKSLEKGKFYYEVFKSRRVQTKRSILIPIILLLATAVTLYLSGYFLIFKNNTFFSLIYMLAVLSILIVHELGHYLVARAYKLKVSIPFFIPGFPYGTFGAIISLKEPFKDRFQSFDVGISGPLLGLIPTFIFFFIGIDLSQTQSEVNKESLFPIPLLVNLIFQKYFSSATSILLHPLAFASILGFIITFLNMAPIAQLDGGHVANSMFPKRHVSSALALIALAVFIFSNFIAMAVLALFLLFFRADPLNLVTNIDKKRKIFGIFFILLWILLMPWPFSSYNLDILK